MKKRFYWLKLKEDFFARREIRKLRRIEKGDTYVIIYQKIMLSSLKNEGVIHFEGTEDTIIEQLAIEIDEDINDVEYVFNFLLLNNLIRCANEPLQCNDHILQCNAHMLHRTNERVHEQTKCTNEYKNEQLKHANENTDERIKCADIHENCVSHSDFILLHVLECIGSESESAQRVRNYRQRHSIAQYDTEALQCNKNVTTEIEIEIEKENILRKSDDLPHAPNGASNTQAGAKSEVPKPAKKDIDDFFEEVWKLYPKKKGKANVRDAQRRKLYNIGKEELQRAIERYLSEMEKEPWRQLKDGSTFFNSGYVDYLDSKYKPMSDARTQASAKPLKPAGIRFDP